jgi:hypothetical protein
VLVHHAASGCVMLCLFKVQCGGGHSLQCTPTHCQSNCTHWLPPPLITTSTLTCQVLRGVMFAKDVVVPGRMRRRIANPRILLLDCPLEYKKGESQTAVELMKEEDWCAGTDPSNRCTHGCTPGCIISGQSMCLCNTSSSSTSVPFVPTTPTHVAMCFKSKLPHAIIPKPTRIPRIPCLLLNLANNKQGCAAQGRGGVDFRRVRPHRIPEA